MFFTPDFNVPFLQEYVCNITSLNKKNTVLETKLSVLNDTFNAELDRFAEERAAITRERESLRVEKLVIERKISLAVAERTKELNDARERSSAALLTALNLTSSQRTKINQLGEKLQVAQTVAKSLEMIWRILRSNFEEYKYEFCKIANDIVTKIVNTKTNIAELSWPKDNNPDKYHVVR